MCAVTPEAVRNFEQLLFPPFQTIMQQDVQGRLFRNLPQEKKFRLDFTSVSNVDHSVFIIAV